jgi:phosphoribosylaminoimidazolecarboxamide formyltransferase / IMP cyclohydrolase
MRLRYGMNPHQTARVVEEHGRVPLRVVSGEPSVINLLDMMNAWQLVREAAAATGSPAATSFKHVSPAGVAIAGDVDATARETWGLSGRVGSLTSACVRARDGDPKSSFGDVIAVSEPVDGELAQLLSRVVADGIVAPGYEPGTVEMLSRKKGGTFLVAEADAAYRAPAWERRDVQGLVLEQERDQAPITADLLEVGGGGERPSAGMVRDALLGMVAVRYTQSNSVALVRDGMAVGIGAGQQNRVDCVKLAAGKATTWWLRRHPHIRGLAAVEGMTRQDRVNWQIRMAEADMTPGQVAEFTRLFGATVAPLAGETRRGWLDRLAGLVLVSDGYLPFRDNVDHAGRVGVRCVVEPGGSTRSPEIEHACAEHGITLIRTGLRLFHH